MPSRDFSKTIGNRDFDLYIGAGTHKVEYSLEIRLANEIVTLWGEFEETDLHVTFEKWAARAIELVVESQNRELPRLQMYEVYLLNLWKRELDSTNVPLRQE